MNINHNLTETDLDNIDIKSPLKHHIQQQEMEDSGWKFVEINSMTIYFHKTGGDLNGSNYVKNPLRISAILNIENDDKYCFLGSILAKLHPGNKNHPNRVSKYRYSFNELNIWNFDFTNGIKCSDIQKFEKVNSLTFIIFEVNFYRDQKKWKLKIILKEISKNETDRVFTS